MALVIVALATLPAIAVLFGWLIGFTIELFLGNLPARWLSDISGREFVKGDVAKLTAILALIATFFKVGVQSTKD